MISLFKNLINLSIEKISLVFNFSKKNSGGAGGNATVSGSGKALGGPGGKGGPFGQGGKGGDAHVQGDGFAAGGEGGDAGQFDGSGRGGRSAAEAHDILNRQLPDGSWLWDYGRGGDGVSSMKNLEK